MARPAFSESFIAVAALALVGAAGSPAAAQQNQTWFELGGAFVSSGDHWGESVALLPDVNGDGHADMIVGAPQNSGVGSAYLVSGKAPHTVLKQWNGGNAGDTLGQVVAYAGLVNADAVPDVMVSAPRVDKFTSFFSLPDAGRVTVLSGASGAVLHTFFGSSASARFGDALAGNADVTGDNRADFIIGAPHWDDPSGAGNEGYVELYNGATGALIKRHEGSDPGGLFGWSVAFVGDLTGDGRNEYAIGAPSEDHFQLFPHLESYVDAGRVRLYNGATHAVLFSEHGYISNAFGTAVCAVGDTDGDGVREFLVGAPGAGEVGTSKGFARHFEGASGNVVRTYEGNFSGERFGTWLSKAGDVDKDGHEELAIGGTEAGVPSGGGFIRVFDGEDGSLVKAHDFLTGSSVSLHASFDGGRDVNADGWPDLLVGLPDSDVIASNAGGVKALGQLHFQPDIGFQGPHAATFTIKGGQLKGGSKADLLLTGGPAGGTPFLLLSAGFGLQSFQGGQLVPKLAGSVLISLPLMPTGTLTLPGIPGGGGPVSFYAQFIVVGYQSGGPICLSNALIIQLEP